MERLEEILVEKNVVWERMKELAHGEGGLNSEDVEAYRAAEVDLDALLAEEDVLSAHRSREDEAAVRTAELADVRSIATGTPVSVDEVIDTEARTSAIYDKWMRGGMKDLTAEERDVMEERAQSTTDSEGGFTVPEGFWNQIIEARLAFGGIRNAGVTSITTASGNALPVPTNDDTGNVGELIAENNAHNEQDTVFSEVRLGAYTWSSKMIRVSKQLLQDSAFDMAAYLAGKLGERIGRAQAGYWITGTGTAQPEGILTNATSGHTTAGGQVATFIWEDFVELEHSIDPAYRGVGEYLLSDDALKQARLIKDTNDDPIWAPGMAVGFAGPTINGFKYTVDQNLPVLAATNTPVVFGDLSYYWIRDVLGIQMLRLEERYAEYLQVAFLAFERSDGKPVTAGDDPYKVLTMAAS